MICTTYFLTFFSELIPPTGMNYINVKVQFYFGKLKNHTSFILL